MESEKYLNHLQLFNDNKDIFDFIDVFQYYYVIGLFQFEMYHNNSDQFLIYSYNLYNDNDDIYGSLRYGIGQKKMYRCKLANILESEVKLEIKDFILFNLDIFNLRFK